MDTPLHPNSNYSSIIDLLESKPSSWIFIPDHSDPWRASLSWITFLLFTFAIPILSHFTFQCYDCQHNLRPFDWIVQVSLSFFSTLSFVSLWRFARKHGLRRFLFLDSLGDEVKRGYSEEIYRSTMLLYAFILPCFLTDIIYNIWWLVSEGTHLPYFYNLYFSHTMACLMHITSWLYRTSLFLLVCVLFKLTCSFQIQRLDDFAQVFDKLSDVGTILVQHLAIKRNLRVISHRFRVFILLTLVLVTMSQFASLLVTTKNGATVNVSTVRIGDTHEHTQNSHTHCSHSATLKNTRDLTWFGRYTATYVHRNQCPNDKKEVNVATASDDDDVLICSVESNVDSQVMDSGASFHATHSNGELALCSTTLVFGLYICQRSAAKITHKAQSLTSLVTKWHMCATVDSFAADINENTRADIVSEIVDSNSDNEAGDGDDNLDNTNFIPAIRHSISYQQRQALVTYFENNETGITVYGFMLDRTSINTVFAIQLSLALWLFDKTIGFG